MMSDQDMGKKEIETSELYEFLEARELITSEKLNQIIGLWTESPDFICVRPDGGLVGVELTKIMQDRDQVRSDVLRYGEARLDPYRVLETIHYQIERKDKTRADHYVKKVKDNVLALELVHGSLDPLEGSLEAIQGEFESFGFTEIWIADFSGLEAYGDIELFGLHPRCWWGRHRRVWADRKPFG